MQEYFIASHTVTCDSTLHKNCVLLLFKKNTNIIESNTNFSESSETCSCLYSQWFDLFISPVEGPTNLLNQVYVWSAALASEVGPVIKIKKVHFSFPDLFFPRGNPISQIILWLLLIWNVIVAQWHWQSELQQHTEVIWEAALENWNDFKFSYFLPLPFSSSSEIPKLTKYLK